jgi:hypothetical protein
MAHRFRTCRIWVRALDLSMVLYFAIATSVGCKSVDGEPDPPDSTPLRDGRQQDTGRRDHSTRDRSATDAFTPLPGFGTLSGQCGELDATEWNSSSPFLFRNAIAFSSASFDTTQLSSGGLQVWTDGNRGGSSLHSEVIAFEVLYRCELAKLLKTEKNITYLSSTGKKTDFLVNIDGRKVGVSVTRAYHYPPTLYTEAEAKLLLDEKLADLPLSKSNATSQDAWTRSILHVLAYDSQYANMVESAWSKQVSATLKGDAILFLTVTNGTDDYIYE